MNKQFSEKISTEKADISLIEEGIIENAIKEGVTIETADVRLFKEINMTLTKGKPYCVLVSAGFMSSITDEARALSASKEFVRQTVAKALLVNSLGQKIVGNFYLKINNPSIKTKVFTEREQALKWLKRMLRDIPAFNQASNLKNALPLIYSMLPHEFPV